MKILVADDHALFRAGLRYLLDRLDDEALAITEAGSRADLSARLQDENDYDLILIDVDHAPDAPLDSTSSAFYTEAGLRAAREHLGQGGVLGVWSVAENADLVSAMESVFTDVRVESIENDNDLVDEQYVDTLFLARC